MKGRTGFVLGVAVGYAIGIKGGRPLYGQVKDAASRVGSTEPAQNLRDATAEPRSRVQQLLGDGLRATSRLLRAS
jgi:hypothetical protein